MADVVQVVTRIGDTVIDIAFVDRRQPLARTSARIDGFVATIDGQSHAITEVPLVTRHGIADVTLTRVTLPEPSLPRPIMERRVAGYVLASLAAHLCLWHVALGYGPAGGEPSGGLAESRHLALRVPASLGAGDDELVGTGERVSMRLPGDGRRTEQRASSLGTLTKETLTASQEGGHVQDVPLDIAGRLMGDTDLAAAIDASAGTNAGGGEPGGGPGGFGGGRATMGPGGGGTGWGTIASGRYGTMGHGSTDGAGWGRGGGAGGLRGRTSTIPEVYICGNPFAPPPHRPCLHAVGDLEKNIIRRYLLRNLNKVQYCYERELLHDATLAGEVETEFLIRPTGVVESATAKGVSPSVSKCIADVLRAIEFPKAVGGGSTQVHYPFTFRPAGG